MNGSEFKDEFPKVIEAPNYTTLTSWWKDWPEIRPELLDFWARGNFVRRLLHRNASKKIACLLRVEYIDEIEIALKRLALLDIDIDFAWIGELSPPVLIVVPQDIDYEDSGGWGYMTCAGDISNKHSSKEWCPAMGWGSLLPDTVTDWLGDEARGFLNDGKIMVAPASHIGLPKRPGNESENELQRISNSISFLHEQAKIRSLFSLELPCIEGMSVNDLYRFCQDYKDSLILFQSALRKLLTTTSLDNEEGISILLLDEIKEHVAELRLSDKTLGLRKTLTAIGATFSTSLITVGLKLGFNPSAAAVGSAGAAIAALTQISQVIEARGQMRKNPYYAIWALQKGKKVPNVFRKSQLKISQPIKYIQ